MNGVTFGTYHSYNDLGLVLTKKTIGAAVAKTATIDIPGADGELDYTEYFGEISYHNRKLSLEFEVIADYSEHTKIYSRIQRLLNGRNMNISFDDDSFFYYIGRVSINEWESDKRIGKIVIEANVAPYKLKKMLTAKSVSVTAATVISYQNLMKKVVPTIIVSAAATVQFGDIIITLLPGVETTDDRILFTEGINILTFTPVSGTVMTTVEYREGEL